MMVRNVSAGRIGAPVLIPCASAHPPPSLLYADTLFSGVARVQEPNITLNLCLRLGLGWLGYPTGMSYFDVIFQEEGKGKFSAV